MKETGKFAIWTVIIIPLLIAFQPTIDKLLHREKVTKEQLTELVADEVTASLQSQFDDIHEENAKFFEELGFQDSLIADLEILLANIHERKGTEKFAIGIRIAPDGQWWYRTSKNKEYKCKYKKEYNWITYFDTQSMQEYPCYYEEHMPLSTLAKMALLIKKSDDILMMTSGLGDLQSLNSPLVNP